jgi:hypothetical protein
MALGLETKLLIDEAAGDWVLIMLQLLTRAQSFVAVSCCCN